MDFLLCLHPSAPLHIGVTFLNLNFQHFEWHACFYAPKAQNHDEPTYEIEYFCLADSWKFIRVKKLRTQHMNMHTASRVDIYRIKMQSNFVWGREKNQIRF